MKVLSMTQPWASLFVLGEAKYETRTWRTRYRGELAIHASKKIDKAACGAARIQELLIKNDCNPAELPTGVILGVCTLHNCVRVIENHQTWAVLENGAIVSGNDFILGDFRVGGYAWEVSDMVMLDQFIPAKGHLGLWEFSVILNERESSI